MSSNDSLFIAYLSGVAITAPHHSAIFLILIKRVMVKIENEAVMRFIVFLRLRTD